MSRFVFISALALGLSVVALADNDKTPATTTITHDYFLGPVSQTSTETARVIVVNTAAPATGNNPAPSCTGTISFMASGTNPPTVTPLTYTVGAGKFATLDLPYGQSGIAAPLPGSVIAKVETKDTVPATAPCSLSFSLVVFDATTDAIHAVIPGPSTTSMPISMKPGQRVGQQ